MKKALLATTLCTLLAGTANAEEQVEEKQSPLTGSVESMTGYNRASLDVRAWLDLGAGFGLFTWQIPSLSYDLTGDQPPTFDHFGLVDLTYNIGPNSDIVIEGEYSAGQFMPRAGLQAYGGIGGLEVYGITSFSGIGPWFEAIGILSYTGSLGKAELFASLEGFIDFDEEGPIYASQRIRVGLGKEHVNVGAALDLVEIPDTPLGVNAGIYVLLK